MRVRVEDGAATVTNGARNLTPYRGRLSASVRERGRGGRVGGPWGRRSAGGRGLISAVIFRLRA